MTGATSGRRCSAERRARVLEEGGRGRVDWWSCLAARREKRSVERAFVCLVGELGDGVVLAVVLRRAACWARMAPAFRSERRSWPFERRGVSLKREGCGVIGWVGSADRNAEGVGFEGWWVL